jgi:hypothetical protein
MSRVPLKRVPINDSRAQRVRLREVRKRRRTLMWYVYAVAFVIAVVGLRAFSYAESYQIDDIEVRGTSRVEEKWIAVDADRVMSRPLMWMFSRKHAWLVPTRSIRETVKQRPEVADASVVVDGRTVRIDVSERAQVVTWCGDGTCFAVDDRGVAFSTTTMPDPTLLSFQASSTRSVGDAVIDHEFLSDIRELATRLKDHSITIDSVVLDSADEATLSQAMGPSVRVARPTIGHAYDLLSAAVRSGEITTERIKTLHYLDLRFEDSIFYQ